jgi:hypothetical protein
MAPLTSKVTLLYHNMPKKAMDFRMKNQTRSILTGDDRYCFNVPELLIYEKILQKEAGYVII